MINICILRRCNPSFSIRLDIPAAQADRRCDWAKPRITLLCFEFKIESGVAAIFTGELNFNRTFNLFSSYNHLNYRGDTW